MKRLLALALAIALVGLGVPVPLAAAQQTGSLAGIAKDSGGQALQKYTVRVRNVDTGQISGTGTTNAAGEFSFTGLNPGNYVVEILDAAGNVIGTTSAISVAAGAAITGVAVSATAAGAAAAGAAAAAVGAGSFFTTTSGVLLLVAAGAGVTAGVVAATGSASK